MPIKLVDDFPAKDILDHENIFAIEDKHARSQDIRPLKLLILNLMPNKIDTETQLLRLVSNTPLQMDVDFLRVGSHTSKHTDISHLAKFYQTLADIEMFTYDAMIITGAPLEHLQFEDVDYWEEMKDIMNWSQRHVFSILHICWGAQAALYHHYGVERSEYNKKLSGVFSQKLCKQHFYLNGFDDEFYTPHSRYTGVCEKQLQQQKELDVLVYSKETGPSILVSKDEKNIFVLGHMEYERTTLKEEYERDIKRGIETDVPKNYFQQNDPNRCPILSWRAHANLFYHNWLNQVYQRTPYDLNDLLK